VIKSCGVGGTRTCIHTASAPLVPEDLTPSLIRTILKDAAVVFFDGRLTEAALVLAAEAKTQGALQCATH
jgi:hypothetical protein